VNTFPSDPLVTLRALGLPEEIEAAARTGSPSPLPPANCHIHVPPNFSAFDSAAEAAALAAEQGVRVLGASNYYDYTVYGPFAAAAAARGVFPLFGLEIIALDPDLARAGVKVNDPGNPGRMYICGKSVVRLADPPPRAAERLRGIRERDAARMAEMTRRLDAHFASRGFPLGMDDEAIARSVAARHGVPRATVCLQERHVARAFQEALFERAPAADRPAALARVLGVSPPAAPREPVRVQTDIRSNLMKAGKPAHVEEAFVTCPEAVELVLDLGGIPCYPVIVDGMNPLPPWEADPETLIRNLRAAGFRCAELIPIRNRAETLKRYVPALRDAGFAVMAGTEHNTLDRLPIEPRCVDGSPLPDAVRDIFREGACVAVAHQFLAAHGRCGLVDGRGAPNPAWNSDDARIRGLARIGAEALRRFGESREAVTGSK
jgi:hypothetical protein